MASSDAKVMTTSPREVDGRSLAERVAAPGYASTVFGIVASIADARETGVVMGQLKSAVRALGADVGVFTSFVRDDATNTSYRSMLACDPQWGNEYARNNWFLDDPWLHHALRSASAIRASELNPTSAVQFAMCEASAKFGFASAVIVPAPSPAGHSRLGMLCLGSATQGYFEADGFAQLKVLAQGLAMELHEWWYRRVRDELAAKVKITADELALLRHEQQGHSSKVIASAMNTQAATIDCRFQRLTSRLGMANRRSALRFAELYGLIPPK